MSKLNGGSIYFHYKAGTYRALYLAETHNHNGDQDVVYLSLTTGKHVTRPFKQDSRKEDAWSDLVKWPDGLMHPRFADALDEFKLEWLKMPCGHYVTPQESIEDHICKEHIHVKESE